MFLQFSQIFMNNSWISFDSIIITHQIIGHVGMTAGGESDIGSECGMPEEVEAAYQVKWFLFWGLRFDTLLDST